MHFFSLNTAQDSPQHIKPCIVKPAAERLERTKIRHKQACPGSISQLNRHVEYTTRVAKITA